MDKAAERRALIRNAARIIDPMPPSPRMGEKVVEARRFEAEQKAEAVIDAVLKAVREGRI